jgi:hypothetical protein
MTVVSGRAALGKAVLASKSKTECLAPVSMFQAQFSADSDLSDSAISSIFRFRVVLILSCFVCNLLSISNSPFVTSLRYLLVFSDKVGSEIWTRLW